MGLNQYCRLFQVNERGFPGFYTTRIPFSFSYNETWELKEPECSSLGQMWPLATGNIDETCIVTGTSERIRVESLNSRVQCKEEWIKRFQFIGIPENRNPEKLLSR